MFRRSILSAFEQNRNFFGRTRNVRGYTTSTYSADGRVIKQYYGGRGIGLTGMIVGMSLVYYFGIREHLLTIEGQLDRLNKNLENIERRTGRERIVVE